MTQAAITKHSYVCEPHSNVESVVNEQRTFPKDRIAAMLANMVRSDSYYHKQAQ